MEGTSRTKERAERETKTKPEPYGTKVPNRHANESFTYTPPSALERT